MVVLGLVLILVAAAATGFAFLASNVGHSSVGLNAYGVSLGVSPSTIFVAGAASLLLLLLGIALIRRGARRKVKQRREIRQLRRRGTQDGSGSSLGSGSSPGSGPSGTGASGGQGSTR